MDIQFIITEDEIIAHSNNFDLGEFIRKRYWNIKKNIDMSNNTDVFVLNDMREAIYSNKLVQVNRNYVSDEGYDKCVICGQNTPYKIGKHINERVGYVEGVGQSCFQPKICENN